MNIPLNHISDNIWLGSIMSLRSEKGLAEAGVTHILSVLTTDTIPIQWENWPIFSTISKHLKISIDDMDNVDIMKHFDTSNAFIDDAVSKGNGVLVHCAAGISRSVTCVCAYLMKKNKWDPTTTIDFVRSKRPAANPNDGFREQLEIYYKCGYEINEDVKPYREWKLGQHISLNKARGEPIYTRIGMVPGPMLKWIQVVPHLMEFANLRMNPSPLHQMRINGQIFSVNERVVLDPNSSVFEFVIWDHVIQIERPQLRKLLNDLVGKRGILRCKGCATTVASSNLLVSHDLGRQGNCQHYFIEPVEWMRPELERGEIEGKLSCPKCHHKVGSYFWQGSKCTCGAWVTPSIKLSKAKVDAMGLPQSLL